MTDTLAQCRCLSIKKDHVDSNSLPLQISFQGGFVPSFAISVLLEQL